MKVLCFNSNGGPTIIFDHVYKLLKVSTGRVWLYHAFSGKPFRKLPLEMVVSVEDYS